MLRNAVVPDQAMCVVLIAGTSCRTVQGVRPRYGNPGPPYTALRRPQTTVVGSSQTTQRAAVVFGTGPERPLSPYRPSRELIGHSAKPARERFHLLSTQEHACFRVALGSTWSEVGGADVRKLVIGKHDLEMDS